MKDMNLVKGNVRRRGAGVKGAGVVAEGSREDDWGEEPIESLQLRRALIAAGRAAMPRQDPALRERVFRRIMERLEAEKRQGVPVRRLDRPSGVTAKMFG